MTGYVPIGAILETEHRKKTKRRYVLPTNVSELTTKGRRRRTAMTDDFLRSVAATFSAAQYGDRYTAVMVKHPASRSAVTNWVRECRRRGFLLEVNDNDGRKAMRKETEK